MIVSFADKASEDIYHGRNTKAARRIPKLLWERIQLKFDLLNAAVTIEDLRIPPANRLEKLRGDLAGFLSIRVNDQYRVIFRFTAGNCMDVRCADYH